MQHLDHPKKRIVTRMVAGAHVHTPSIHQPLLLFAPHSGHAFMNRTSICSWSSGEWGSCDKDCNQGNQQRSVKCLSSKLEPVNDVKCLDQKPDTDKPCNKNKCEEYNWHAGEFDECSQPCGGNCIRKVLCRQSDGQTVDDNKCAAGQRPVSNETCNNGACVWVPGDWGKCSQPCKGGTRDRPVICRSQVTNKVVPSEGNCKVETLPAASEACNEGTCRWHIGDWSQCSKDCGSGTQSRSVVCHDNSTALISEEHCEDEKPTQEQQCNKQVCSTFNWVHIQSILPLDIQSAMHVWACRSRENWVSVVQYAMVANVSSKLTAWRPKPTGLQPCISKSSVSFYQPKASHHPPPSCACANDACYAEPQTSAFAQHQQNLSWSWSAMWSHAFGWRVHSPIAHGHVAQARGRARCCC